MPGVIPLILVPAGAAMLAAGWLLVRRLGPRARVGRILAATRIVPVAEARALAEGGARRYVGVRGRVDADRPFQDENQRPLVLRRRRLELRGAHGWTAFEDDREMVPFAVREGLEAIAVDGEALDDGLVTVVRESEGRAADLGDRVPPGTSPDTPARLRLELLSSVDHAIVLGVPVLDPDRGPILRPGLGRPLVLTTLEPPEAMRLLAAGRQGTTRAAAALLSAGSVALLAGLALSTLDALV